MTAPRVHEEKSKGASIGGRIRWDLLVGAWLLAWLIAVAIAMALMASGDWDRGLEWERAFLRTIHPLPPWLDTLMLVVPWAGSNFFLLPITLGSAAWLHWRAGRSALAAHLLVMHAGVMSLTFLVKEVFRRDRPDLWEPRGQYAHASYPSGHLIASIAVMFTYAILLHRERGWIWPFAVAAVILAMSAYSRLYLGVHWPTDLLAGALMGIVWLLGTLRAFPPRVVDRPPDAR